MRENKKRRALSLPAARIPPAPEGHPTRHHAGTQPSNLPSRDWSVATVKNVLRSHIGSHGLQPSPNTGLVLDVLCSEDRGQRHFFGCDLKLIHVEQKGWGSEE